MNTMNWAGLIVLSTFQKITLIIMKSNITMKIMVIELKIHFGWNRFTIFKVINFKWLININLNYSLT